MEYWYAAKCKCGQVVRISYVAELRRSFYGYNIYHYEHLTMYSCKFTNVDSKAINRGYYGTPPALHKRLEYVLLINLVCNNCDRLVNLKRFERLIEEA